ncbi:MAG: hypothetical protein HOQ24_03285 [Mycobacteriaceae bacterium]|nr:hypothetical protein [Mycobacteriaceae bacterium]
MTAIWAGAGALGLIAGLIDLGETVNSRLPWRSPVLSGVALAVVVAAPMSAAALLSDRRDARAAKAAVSAGALLVGWIIGQLCVIRTFSWLQPVCLALGVAVLVLGSRMRRTSGA